MSVGGEFSSDSEPLPVGGGGAPASPTFPGAAGTDIKPVVAIPRFCTGCGEPWDVTWLLCPFCEKRRGADSVHPQEAVGIRPIKSAIWLYFAFLGTSVIAIIAIASGAAVVPTQVVATVVVSAIVGVWCLAGWRQVWPGLARWPELKWFGVAVAGSVVTFGVATAALAALRAMLGVPRIELTSEFAAAGYGPAMVILLIAAQPGIFEELAFRGVILGGLGQVLSPMETVIVSAAMFMIIHLSVPSFPHLFVIGLALGWLRLKSGSLYPCMVLHFGHNLLCVLSERWRILGQ